MVEDKLELINYNLREFSPPDERTRRILGLVLDTLALLNAEVAETRRLASRQANGGGLPVER